MIGWTLPALVIVSLLAIGCAALVAPRPSSAQYGLPVDDARALMLVRAMGARDAVIGAVLGLMAITQARQTLGWAMCITALIAVADLAIVGADRWGSTSAAPGRPDTAHALHAGGAVGLVVTGAALLAGY